MYFSRSRVTLSLVVCWCLPILYWTSSYPLIGNINSKECNILFFPVFANYMQLFLGACFTIVIVIMYIQIFWEIRKQQRHIHDVMSAGVVGIRSQLKLTITLVVTVGCFVICYFPEMICIIVWLSNPQTLNEPTNLLFNLSQFSAILSVPNSGLNPLIYIIRMKIFRKAYFHLFQCHKCLPEMTE